MSNLREDIIRLSGEEVIEEDLATAVKTVVAIAGILSSLSSNNKAIITTNNKTYTTPTNQIVRVVKENPSATVEVETTIVPQKNLINSIEMRGKWYYEVTKNEKGETLYKELVGRASVAYTSIKDIAEYNKKHPDDPFYFEYTNKYPSAIVSKFKELGYELRKKDKLPDKVDIEKADYIRKQFIKNDKIDFTKAGK